MDNAGIARVLEKLSQLLQVQGAIVFKVQAIERAAQLIQALDQPLAQVYKDGGVKALTALPGIGQGIAAKIAELCDTGRCAEYEKIKKELPAGIEDLLEVPNLGPKTALLVAKELKVRSIADLEKVLTDGRFAKLPRMGEKQAERILKGLKFQTSSAGRIPLSTAMAKVEGMLGVLRARPDVARAEFAGSLRRMRETVGDLDLLVIPKKADASAAIITAFTKLPGVKEVVAHGPTKASVRLEGGIEADLRVVEKESFGAAWHYFTGSKAHNIRIREMAVKKGLSINEYGILKGKKRTGGADEAEIFRAVGLPWIPPELREDGGEIELAAKGKLPRLIEPGDLKGDLHMHSTWSDGTNSIAEMAAAAKKLGYAYIALCDHSQSLKMAGGLSIADLKKKNKEIAALNAKKPGIRILKGTEVDILADGSLDYPDDVLAELEVVVASIHTRFELSESENTKRAIKALSHPKVTVFAHPTGRLLGKRAGYPINIPEVIKAAKHHGKCLEINAQPQRLDLNDVQARAARAAGVPILIDADAHRAEDLGYARKLGVGIARRAGLEAGDVLNTLPLDKLQKRIAR